MTNLQFISLLSTAIGSFVLVIIAWDAPEPTDLRTTRGGGLVALGRIPVGSLAKRSGIWWSAAANGKVKPTLNTLSADYQSFYGLEQELEGSVDELSKRIK